MFDFQKYLQHEQIESNKTSLSNILHYPASSPKFGLSITLFVNWEKIMGGHENPM